jgi:hypothetical protein
MVSLATPGGLDGGNAQREAFSWPHFCWVSALPGRVGLQCVNGLCGCKSRAFSGYSSAVALCGYHDACARRSIIIRVWADCMCLMSCPSVLLSLVRDSNCTQD